MIVDLCCGHGGWVVPGHEREYVGVDIASMPYPGHFIQDDVRAWRGEWLKRADLIVASPPCESFSLAGGKRDGRLFDVALACWAICIESGRPWVIENVRGAISWFGVADAHYGSYYLWGPAIQLIPQTRRAIKSLHRSYVARSRIPPELARAICGPYLD